MEEPENHDGQDDDAVEANTDLIQAHRFEGTSGHALGATITTPSAQEGYSIGLFLPQGLYRAFPASQADTLVAFFRLAAFHINGSLRHSFSHLQAGSFWGALERSHGLVMLADQIYQPTVVGRAQAFLDLLAGKAAEGQVGLQVIDSHALATEGV